MVGSPPVQGLSTRGVAGPRQQSGQISHGGGVASVGSPPVQVGGAVVAATGFGFPTKLLQESRVSGCHRHEADHSQLP